LSTYKKTSTNEQKSEKSTMTLSTMGNTHTNTNTNTNTNIQTFSYNCSNFGNDLDYAKIDDLN